MTFEWSPRDFWKSTPHEFYAAFEAYEAKQKAQQEQMESAKKGGSTKRKR